MNYAGKDEKAVKSLVHNVALHKGFVGRAGEKATSEKTAVAELENVIRLGKYFCVDGHLCKGEAEAEVM